MITSFCIDSTAERAAQAWNIFGPQVRTTSLTEPILFDRDFEEKNKPKKTRLTLFQHCRVVAVVVSFEAVE